MTTQIEAERLADELVSMWDKGYLEREDVEQAAAKLRRLHEANEKLVDMFHELSEVQRKTELERYRLHEVNKDLLDVLAIVADAENYDFTLADCKEISRAAISRAQP